MNSHVKRLVFWISVYVSLALVVIVIVLFAATQIKSHRLPVGYIQLSTSSSKYFVGDKVIFIVTNHLSSKIYLNNNCPDEPLNVYKWQNGSWIPIHYLTDKKYCINQERRITIPEDTSIEGDYGYWSELFKDPGKYRIEADVFNYNARPYQEFEVIAKPIQPSNSQKKPQSNSVLTPNNSNSAITSTPSPTPTAARTFKDDD